MVQAAIDPSVAYPFERGFPTPEASRRALDDTDLERALTAYRFWYPTVSAEGIYNGLREAGLQDNQSMMMQATGPRHVMFTGNSDTPYGAAVLDVGDGPWVVEVPPGPIIGIVNDHHQDWIADMGVPGPAGDKGGRHLLLPPDHEGPAPAGYFAARSPTNKVLVGLRSLPVDGHVPTALDRLRQTKVYPLSAAAPKPLPIVDISDKEVDCTCLRWEDNLEFWRKLHAVIDAEPLAQRFLPMYGELSALGIEKGKPFAPDERIRAILQRAARMARMRSSGANGLPFSMPRAESSPYIGRKR